MIRRLALILAGAALAFTVRRCQAPPGWYVNGVDPDGWADLRPVLGDPAADLADARARRDIIDHRRIVVRIHCTGGATPRQDGSSVWCQR